jgi:sugar-specific transcriptional regulator TrmB
MIDSVVELLKKIGLTEYEAKAYNALLSDNINSAAKLAEKSNVPRTRIYEVLESLANKGWVKIYSGVPLLFRHVSPQEVLQRKMKEYERLIQSVHRVCRQEVEKTKEKFVITNHDIGFETLRQQIQNAKTISISNGTSKFFGKIKDSISPDAEVRIVLFPGEKVREDERVKVKEAEMKVVHIFKNKEIPATNVILDEERIFNVIDDPARKRYIVTEMLYEECMKCFGEWWNLGWLSAEENRGL